jgi:YHS domain-containing protein
MADIAQLTSRIDAEFADVQKKIDTFQQQAKEEYAAREKRYQELFVPALQRIPELLRPRMQVLVDKFKDKVKFTPVVTERLRQCTFQFDSRMARIALTFRVSHDAPVKNLVFDQTLEVLPILMQFDKHASLTVPLDNIDEGKITQWVDDRIVAFIKTFLAIHQNQYYQKDSLVTDPVAGVEMPRYAAKCTLESAGKTYYFVSEETRREFEQQKGAGAAK